MTIRRFAAAILALVIIVAASPALSEPPHQPDSLDPRCGVLFFGNSAHILTDSFFSGEEFGALWNPTPSEISQLEEALSRELRYRLRAVRTPTNGRIYLRDYFRQYAGIYLKGQRLIFINGFHRAYVNEVAVRNRESWRKVPVHVDDGGAFFFTAFYDPQSRRIVGFQFNGIG